MNETRIRIIELLEPYMDKTVSDGVIVRVKKTIQDWELKDVEPYLTHCYHTGKGKYMKVWGRNDVVWHYSMDAVFKYMLEFKFWYFVFTNDEYKFVYMVNMWYCTYLKETSSIPNKPLNLYTEEEDKMLLDLLLKLQQWAIQ